MNCIIVDDDAMSRSLMSHLVSKVPFLHLKGEFANASEALDILSKREIDLLLLDIEMPDLSGLSLLKTLPHPPITILATSKKEYAIEAFEYNVVDYLLKPISIERFLKSAAKAKEVFDSASKDVDPEHKHLFIKVNGMLTKIMINDILWIEALGDYINIYTNEKKYTIHTTMKLIESKLPESRFVRVHRSYIVSLDTIDTIDDGTIVINKQLIPIGAVYKDRLSKRLNLL